jgi:hypothetical protein
MAKKADKVDNGETIFEIRQSGSKLRFIDSLNDKEYNIDINEMQPLLVEIFASERVKELAKLVVDRNGRY